MPGPRRAGAGFQGPRRERKPAGFSHETQGRQTILPVELADCEVMEQLGHGSTGSVYRIQETPEYAVRVIPCARPGARANAKREYETGVRFAAHSHVIRFLRFYEDENLCWSRSAAQSVWVGREWPFTADYKGIHAIEPFPLESSAECPIPPRLSELHFDDIEVMIRSSRLFGKTVKGSDCE